MVRDIKDRRRLFAGAACLLTVLHSASASACVDDGMPPELQWLTLKPDSVDTTTSEAVVSVSFGIKDAAAPIDLCSGSLRSPDPANPQFVVLSGSKVCWDEGKTCKIVYTGTVLPHVVSGTWTIEISCRDSPCVEGGLRNTLTVAGPQLAALGFPSTVKVTSGTPDVQPPALVGFQFKQSTVDVTQGPAQLEVTMTLEDDVSGVESCLLTFRSPDAVTRATLNGTEDCNADRTSCVFHLVTTLYETSVPGVWTPVLFCRDAVQNRLLLTDQQISELGFPTQVTIKTDVPDTRPPSLLSFTISDSLVNVAAKDAVVETTAVLLDLESSLADCTLIFHSPEDGTILVGESSGQSCSADLKRCTFVKSVVVPTAAEAGAWRPTLLCGDVLQNREVWGPQELTDGGFQNTLQVVNEVKDTTPPEVLSVETSATAVSPGGSLELVVTARDLVTKLDGCSASLVPSDGGQGYAFAHNTQSCGVGNLQCTYSMRLTLPAGAPAGQHLVHLTCRDTLGNAVAAWGSSAAEVLVTDAYLLPGGASVSLTGLSLPQAVTPGSKVQATTMVTNAPGAPSTCLLTLSGPSKEVLALLAPQAGECQTIYAGKQSCVVHLEGELPASMDSGPWLVAVHCNGVAFQSGQLGSMGFQNQMDIISLSNPDKGSR